MYYDEDLYDDNPEGCDETQEPDEDFEYESYANGDNIEIVPKQSFFQIINKR